MNLTRIKKVLAFLMVVLMFCTLFCVSSNAESSSYQSYNFYIKNGQKIYEDDKDVFEVNRMLTGEQLGIGGFSEISDMHVSNDGLLYILDSANGRILVLDKEYSLKYKIDSFYYNDELLKLSKPQGIYVSSNDNLYIADTENSRVLVCSLQGNVNRIISLPKSDLIPDKFDFFPMCVISDKNDFLYVLTRGSYYGAMVFDNEYKFVGFYGSNKVASGVLDGISSFLSSIFETNEKLSVTQKKLPFQFSDFAIDSYGFFYTVSNDPSKNVGQVRKLNLPGNDILYFQDDSSSKSSTSYNFGEATSYFDQTGREFKQNFCSITVDDDGYIYILDDAYGKVYAYDSECKSITVFGGGMASGMQKGIFHYATCVEAFGDDILVSDAHTNRITVFSLTEYGMLIKKANTLTLKNDHTTAKPIWEDVLKQNSQSVLAYAGLTKYALEQEDYQAVFEYSKKANDKESYAIAFENLEKDYFAKNFWWISVLAILVISGIIALKLHIKKKNISLVKNENIRHFGHCLIHPFDGFSQIKEKNKGSLWISLVILLLFYISTVGSNLWVGFVYYKAYDYNIIYALLGTIGIVILWIIVEWAVSALFQGNGKINEIAIVTSYSLVPIIAYNVFFIIYSHIVVTTGTSFIGIIQAAFIIYAGALLLIGLITIHEYSAFKVIGTSILTVIGMMIVAFIILMMLSLSQNFIGFIVNVFSEIVYR